MLGKHSTKPLVCMGCVVVELKLHLHHGMHVGCLEQFALQQFVWSYKTGSKHGMTPSMLTASMFVM